MTAKQKRISALIATGACLMAYFSAASFSQHDQLKNAIDAGDTAQVIALLKAGADANQEICTQYEGQALPDFLPYPVQSALASVLPKTCRDPSPVLVYLMRPSTPNRAAIAEAMLKSGAKVNATDYNNNTALGRAVVENDEAAVRVLLDHGADPNLVGFEGDVPLFAALQNEKQLPILRLLMRRGAKIVPCSDDKRVLLEAAHFGNHAALQLALEHGAKIDECGYFGFTALMYAAGHNPKVAAFLLAHGANPGKQDASGQTALHYAIGYDNNNQNAATVRLLMKHGASLFVKNKDGIVPLDEMEIVCRANGRKKTNYDQVPGFPALPPPPP